MDAGDKIKILKGKFSFSGSMTKNFDQHVSKSVPLYSIGHYLICKLSSFFIQNKSFAYDLSLSNFALYRGSTSIITALSKNLVPIYYKYFGDSFNIDPIYDYTEDKFIVKDVDDFVNVLNKFYKLKKKINLKKLSYARSFYTPQNKSTVINFFNKITNQ